ncbi:MAG TPA: DUF2905 domain-containing protein [Bacteroidetes bacterium]|nr:DUF2905 domain-containing protein [Bacteroidota bacterium]
MQDLGRLLLITGLILVLAGGVLLFAGKMGWAPLPGDIVTRVGPVRLYIPLATSLLISLLLTGLLWLLHR